MELLTKELKETLKHHPLGCTEDLDDIKDAEVLIHYFNPVGLGDWYVLEAEFMGDDVLFFGYVSMFFKELGYFSLNELRGVSKLGIERDLYWGTHKLEDVME